MEYGARHYTPYEYLRAIQTCVLNYFVSRTTMYEEVIASSISLPYTIGEPYIYIRDDGNRVTRF